MKKFFMFLGIAGIIIAVLAKELGLAIFLLVFVIIIARRGKSNGKKSDSCTASSTHYSPHVSDRCNCGGSWEYFVSGHDTWQGSPATKRRCSRCGRKDSNYIS